jgi:ABC-type glycerol-3-phosphate transport system permease component
MSTDARVATASHRTTRIGVDQLTGNAGKYVFLAFFAALCLLPLLLIFSAALKDPSVARANPFALFSTFRPQNILDAWTLGGFGRYFLNTVLITIPVVVGVVTLSILAGYALARFEFPGRSLVFYLFVLGIMIPFTSLMIPLYYILRDTCMPEIGPWAATVRPDCLLDTHAAVIFPSIAGANGAGLPLGIFLMRAFFADMPRELADAARVDGATEFGVFRHVMLPLAAPGAMALAVFAFLQAWNTLLLPLIYMPGEGNRTLATGLLAFMGGRTREVELIAAGSFFMIAPVLVFYILFQRQFIQGMTAGAVKN